MDIYNAQDLVHFLTRQISRKTLTLSLFDLGQGTSYDKRQTFSNDSISSDSGATFSMYIFLILTALC